MKFHKHRTSRTSAIEGVEAYERAFAVGTLRRVVVTPCAAHGERPTWQRTSLTDVALRDDDAAEPLEVSNVAIEPRALIVDELTRHRSTLQIFIPVTGPFMAVVAPSRPDDRDAPDAERLRMVPVAPGEAFVVGRGIWHTLPYVFSQQVLGLSVMHRETLDAYHDVRDLAAEGWIGVLALNDPATP